VQRDENARVHIVAAWRADHGPTAAAAALTRLLNERLDR
jgi:hypothetical protein